jgi:hypothetical protein
VLKVSLCPKQVTVSAIQNIPDDGNQTMSEPESEFEHEHAPAAHLQDQMDAQPADNAAPEPRLERSDDGRGEYVEKFPYGAGKPISPFVGRRPGLEEYMKTCGRLANPEWFSVAELLTTTKMTDKARTRHLKHSIVSQLIIHRYKPYTHKRNIVPREDPVEELQNDE